MTDHALSCETIEQQDLLEAYVRGGLSDEEQARVEQHYFGCDACFERLETLRAVQVVLTVEPRSALTSRSSWRGLAMAAGVAGVLVAGGLAVWLTRPDAARVQKSRLEATNRAGQPAASAAEPASAPPVTEAPAPVAPAPAPAPAPSVAPRPEPTLAELARVEAPPFLALTVRGVEAAPDERFRAAMARYTARDYRGALPLLDEVLASSTDRVAARFFRAVCLLLTGSAAKAADGFEDTIARGDSPYYEDAHWFRAKAALARGDAAGARHWLQQTIALGGDREAEARHLLKQLAQLSAR